MNTICNKKNITILSVIFIIDIIIIGGWTLYFKPSTDMAIAYAFIIPLVFLANLVIAGIIYFVKKHYTPFFVLNAFFSSIILYFFFVLYSEMVIKKNYESWSFKIDNIGYEINYRPSDEDNSYWVYTSFGGGSMGYDRGTVKEKNDTVYFLSVDSTQYYIYKDSLYNFKGIDKIRVKKKY